MLKKFRKLSVLSMTTLAIVSSSFSTTAFAQNENVLSSENSISDNSISSQIDENSMSDSSSENEVTDSQTSSIIDDEISSIIDDSSVTNNNVDSDSAQNNPNSLNASIDYNLENSTSTNKNKKINYNGLNFKIKNNSQGTVEVTGCDSNVTKLTIPSSFYINGKKYIVKSIGKNAFKSNQNLTSVVIPDSITQIKDKAFAHCANIKTVSIGSGVNNIGRYAFYRNKNATITLNNTYSITPKSVGVYCFYDITKLIFKSSSSSTDSTKALQACLDSIYKNPNNLYFKFQIKGKFAITSKIQIHSNTLLYAKGATITQKSNGVGLIISAKHRNSAYGEDKAGYNSCENVTVNGGNWISNTNCNTNSAKKSNGFRIGFSSILFLHSNNITIKNCTIKNNYNGHLIELAAVDNAKIYNCKLGGNYIGESDNEAIQIDNTQKYSNIPPAAVHDKIASNNIKIDKCTINIRGMRGIGTNKVGIKEYRNISITNNKITTTSECLNMQDVIGYTIKNNTVKLTGRSNNYTSHAIVVVINKPISNWGNKKCVIANNTITGYNAGLKFWAEQYVKTGNLYSKFGPTTIRNNKLYSHFTGRPLFYIPYQFKTISVSGNKIGYR